MTGWECSIIHIPLKLPIGKKMKHLSETVICLFLFPISQLRSPYFSLLLPVFSFFLPASLLISSSQIMFEPTLLSSFCKNLILCTPCCCMPGPCFSLNQKKTSSFLIQLLATFSLLVLSTFWRLLKEVVDTHKWSRETIWFIGVKKIIITIRAF